MLAVESEVSVKSIYNSRSKLEGGAGIFHESSNRYVVHYLASVSFPKLDLLKQLVLYDYIYINVHPGRYKEVEV